MRTLSILALALAALCLGCRNADEVRGYEGTDYDESVHVHDRWCGHTWDGYGWTYFRDHVHGPGCGHNYINGKWSMADFPPTRSDEEGIDLSPRPRGRGEGWGP